MYFRTRKSTLVRNAYCALAIAAVVCITASAWAGETVLYSFPGGANGAFPTGILAMDSSGNLYGATNQGGVHGNCAAGFCGIVFELSPNAGGSWTETVLYTFQGTTDGGGVILGAGDTIFGTTGYGGSAGAGNVWQLSHSGSGWTVSVLYDFQGATDGTFPSSTLIFGAHTDLYGATGEGGNTKDCNGVGCGTIFHLSRSGSTWSKKTLFRFNETDGKEPVNSGLIKDSAGNLYGITGGGGSSGDGVVFQFTP